MTRAGNYKGRPYSKKTRLGKIMYARGHEKLYVFAAEVDISGRTLSKYLAGEKIREDHLITLALKLNTEGKFIQEVENGGVKIERKRTEDREGREAS